MLFLSALFVCTAASPYARIVGPPPNYKVAVDVLPPHGPPYRSQDRLPNETDEQRDRRLEEEAHRLELIKLNILQMLGMPCVPRAPTHSSIDGNRILYNSWLAQLQNRTGPEREDLLKRAQSFYPACEASRHLHGDAGARARFGQWTRRQLRRAEMNINFNLTSFFVTMPEDVEIDVAELRLYNKKQQAAKESSDIYGVNDDKIRVSIYTPTDSSYTGTPLQLIDSVMVSTSADTWVRFNVRSALRSAESGDQHQSLALRVACEDINGNAIPTEEYFEDMDCDSTIPSSPIPGVFLELAGTLDVESSPMRVHYPVLDLRTAEDAREAPRNGALPSIEPCEYPLGQLWGSVAPTPEPRYQQGLPLNQLERRHRRHHHRRGGRRHRHHGQRHRGQH